MSTQEYIISFYSIFIGVAGSSIVISWAKILKDYPSEKVSWSQLAWSLFFFLLLIWEWFIRRTGYDIGTAIDLFISLINPILLFTISYLILPQKENDHSFEGQKSKVALLAFIWSINKYYNPDISIFFLDTSRVQIALGIVAFGILLFDKRKIVWDAAAFINLVYFFSIFSNFLGQIFSISWLALALAIYFGIALFKFLKNKSLFIKVTSMALIIGTISIIFFNRRTIAIKVIANNQYLTAELLEKKIGIRASFNYLPEGWTPILKRNMTTAWTKMGVSGMSYFSFGGPDFFKNYSSREDIRSKNYQAWIGAYIIQVDSQKVFHPDTIRLKPQSGIYSFFKLGDLDQSAWLQEFTDSLPKSSILGLRVVDSIRLNGNQVSLFKIKVKSRSDLTMKKTIMSEFLGTPNPSVWTDKVEEFHDTLFHCLCAISYDTEHSCFIIVYAAASEFKLSNGTTINNFDKTKDDLMNSIRNIIVTEL